jgi:DNA-binding MarR family transcriptional regulator
MKVRRKMKQEFIEFLCALMAAAPDVADKMMTENVKAYIAALTNSEEDKPLITDSGKMILKYLQDNANTPMMKARDIAEGLFVSSRAVSGSLRKLVNDGFCEKVGKDPVVYALTAKGKEFKIED